MRQGYGLPRQGQDVRPTIPPMPVGWTQEAVRLLFPIRLGVGRKVIFRKDTRPPGLLLLRGQAQPPESFAGTPQGWVDLWTMVPTIAKGPAVKSALDEVGFARRSALATPFRDAKAALESDQHSTLVLGGLVVVGGTGFGDAVKTGAVVDLRLAAETVVLTDVRNGDELYSVPGEQLIEAEASGPGQVTSGGFGVTVGHGLVGDLVEQASAKWMSDRYGTTTITTSIRIQTDSSELFLRSFTVAPDIAQVALSPLRRIAPRAQPDGRAGAVPAPPLSPGVPAGTATPTGASDDLISQLERLARLRESGALSDDEYALAKGKLLS